MSTTAERSRLPLVLLFAAAFLGNFDRLLMVPLLAPAGNDLHRSLGVMALTVTAYLLCFGVMQPVTGALSDRFGRVAVLRGGLVGLAVGAALTTAAPNVPVLIVARAVAGGAAAAVLPIAVAYLGDWVPFGRRQRTMAAMLGVGALGAAAGTVSAGVLADVLSWRAAAVVVLLAAPALALLVGRLPDAAPGRSSDTTARQRFGAVLGAGWFRFLAVLGIAEGAVMLGFFNYFAPALQHRGYSAATAGLVVGAYGLAALAGGGTVRLLGPRLTAAASFGIGGGLLCLGYLAAAVGRGIVGVLVGSVLAGLAFALVQSVVQAWATEVAPPYARGTATALVACAAFVGAAVGTGVVRGLADSGRFGLLFGIAAAVTVPVAVVGAVGRSRFRPATPPV